MTDAPAIDGSKILTRCRGEAQQARAPALEWLVAGDGK